MPCLVHLWWCFAACGALRQLSFVVGSVAWRQRNTERHLTERHQQAPSLLVDKDARALSVKLTSRKKKAESAKALIELLDKRLDGPFDFEQASSWYHSLATWKRRRGLQSSHWDSPVVARLHARVQQIVLEDQLNEQAFANIFWSIAKVSDRFSIPTELVDALVKSLPAKAKGMKQQELSKCLWACAQLKDLVPVLQAVPAIVSQIPSKAKGMTPQHLSNCLWATVQLKKVVPDVLEIVPAITVQIPDKAKGMKPQELSSCLWACAQLKDDAPEVLEIVLPVVKQVRMKIKDMNAQDLSTNLEALVPLQKLVPEIARLVADSNGREDILRSSAARLSTLLPRLRGKDLSIAVPSVIRACAKLGRVAALRGPAPGVQKESVLTAIQSMPSMLFGLVKCSMFKVSKTHSVTV
eukprot:Skav220751  [mRNA]  locus=scaffold6504:16934:18163:- [translate_table: standard]